MCLHASVTRLLGAAILLLAAYLAPSLAQAHEGHALPKAPSQTLGPAHARSNATAHMAAASQVTQAVAEHSTPPLPSGPCQRDCCNPGMRCCVSAPVVEPALSLPLATVRRQVPLRAVRMPPGRMPEALPKPPRPLA